MNNTFNEEQLSLKTLTVGVHRPVLTLIRLTFLKKQCINAFLPILERYSDYFHINPSSIGLSDGNIVSSARYEVRLCRYMQIPTSFENKDLLYIMRLFASFRVFGLGKLSLAQVCDRVLRFFPFSITQNLLITRKRTNKNPNYTSFILISTIPSCVY